ncbi:MAG: hypothetical protein IJO81_06190 [Clostridia bacterium]|nr:hypothetical protein [Clostridia bacterium]
MKNIADVDSNFKIKTSIQQEGIRFFDPRLAPFSIHGVKYEDGRYRRMPYGVASTVSESVEYLHSNTAGGRVRFRTDSPYVAISARLANVCKMASFALTGSASFDIYAKGERGVTYINSFCPFFEMKDGYDSIIYLGSSAMRDITVNFPLYTAVESLYVGIDENAALLECTPYLDTPPIVYYGSSITQGGCASRPGNSYESLISRRFNRDFINLGFSGSAKAEPEIAEYVKSLDMSVFVYDYDHNAHSVDYLCETHERMFKTVRSAHPDLPVIMMSRPVYDPNDDEKARIEVIRETYQNALDAGDTNVYLIEGRELMALARDEGLVDACHPNDLGFASMAAAIIPVMEKIFAKAE